MARYLNLRSFIRNHRTLILDVKMRTRSLELSTASLLGVEWAETVNWVTKTVNDTAKQFWTDWNVDLNQRINV